MRQPPRGDGARGIATARALRKCGVVWGGGDREMPAPSLRCPSGHPTSRTTATSCPPSWRCLWAPLMQREKGRHEWALEGAAVGVFNKFLTTVATKIDATLTFEPRWNHTSTGPSPDASGGGGPAGRPPREVARGEGWRRAARPATG